MALSDSQLLPYNSDDYSNIVCATRINKDQAFCGDAIDWKLMN